MSIEKYYCELFTLYDIFEQYHRFFKNTINNIPYIENFKIKAIIASFDKAMYAYDLVLKTINTSYIKNKSEISIYQNYINNNKSRLEKINEMTKIDVKLRMYKLIYYDELNSLVSRLERLVQNFKVKELGYVVKCFHVLINCVGNVLDELSHGVDIDIIHNN